MLNSEELHRLGFGEGHTQAYLDSYKLHTGFSSAMAAGNDVTALYLYSEPNSILMSEYATAQVGRPTETQIQKTNLEETLRRASAISAAAAMREETGFFVMEDMEKLLPKIEIKKL